MEKAILMVDDLNVSQIAGGSFSHRGDKAIDIAGKDGNIDSLKAPFTGIIKRIYSNVNAVWLESIEKVEYADGTVDYMTVLTIHDDDVNNLRVGKIVEQGEVYYHEGTRGNVTGNHIHLSVCRGKFTGNGWTKNEFGNWVSNNQYDVHKALYLLQEINIITDIPVIEEKFTTHIVIKGDNLTNISKKYNTNIAELVRLNNIKNKNLIFIGQELKVPNKVIYFKKYNGNSKSIVDALNEIEEESSYNYRALIAAKNNIKNYTGTSIQNNKLLKLHKEGKLIK